MNTKHQYILLSASPEKEKLFQEYRQKYKSVYAFHGSALSNWHAILRSGLVNMSGTKGQANGAAYGNGVYLADDCHTSFSYMRYTQGWKNSIFGTNNIGCMAMCEIIKHESLKNQPNPYYVVANDALITTRFFFIFPGSGSGKLVGSKIKIKDVRTLN